MKSLLLLPFVLAQLVVYSSAYNTSLIRNPAGNAVEPLITSTPTSTTRKLVTSTATSPPSKLVTSTPTSPPWKLVTRPVSGNQDQFWVIDDAGNNTFIVGLLRNVFLAMDLKFKVGDPVWVTYSDPSRFTTRWRITYDHEDPTHFVMQPGPNPKVCIGQAPDETLIVSKYPGGCQKWTH